MFGSRKKLDKSRYLEAAKFQDKLKLCGFFILTGSEEDLYQLS